MSAPDFSLAEAQTLLREMVAEAQDLKQAAGGSVTDAVAAWLAPHDLLAARAKLAVRAEAGRFEVLRTFLHDRSLLRRGDPSAARLQLEREQLDRPRANGQAQQEQEFRAWIQRPEVRGEFLPERTRGLSPKTLEKIERELRLL